MIVGQRRSDMLAVVVVELRGSAPPCPLGVVPAGQVVSWALSAPQTSEFTGPGVMRGLYRRSAAFFAPAVHTPPFRVVPTTRNLRFLPGSGSGGAF